MLGLLQSDRTQLIYGVSEEARSGVVAAMTAKTVGITVLLVANPRQAETFTTECETYIKWMQTEAEVLYFPEEPPTDIDVNRQADLICDRLRVLSMLLKKATHSRLLIATPEALLGACPERKRFEARRIKLRIHNKTSFSELVNRLTQELDYDNETLCEYPGQIAVRGGLLDIYPYDASQPYRLDFFGDEIESIRIFDPTTQRTKSTVVSLVVSASDHRDTATDTGTLIHYLPEVEVSWLLDEPDRLIQDHPFRFEKTTNPARTIRTIHQLFKRRAESKDRYVAICEFDTDPEPFKGTERIKLDTEPTAHYRRHTDSAQSGYNRFESEQSARQKFEAQIAEWAKQDKLNVLFVTQSTSEAERISALIKENPLTAKLTPQFLTGSISGGFIYRQIQPTHNALFTPLHSSRYGFVIITAHEFFGHRQHKLGTRRKRARPVISQVDQMLDFTELADGDRLVHLQHGICLFRGLTKLKIQDGSKEVISVEFADTMTIHVPLHESHLLTRYVGLTKKAPKLGKIGGTIWKKTRSAAEIATFDYAAELLNLHAQRNQSDGYAFPSDHLWQKEFEEAFPFKETPDQLSAIEATKKDMEKPNSMDRLICGDVGFGKTEVAIRAALKAVLAGKQVAMLVPTTTLCQQHFNTFRERMAQYPVIIDQISRFQTPGQNRQTLDNLAEGKIDIVIGTHRLLSKDVHFKDLGLLVVDEEQRFGVKQKEIIKKLRTDVDILTLSATPIPRTLYMALAGARSMSVIETPPDNRRPIETIVKSYDLDLIKSAIQIETDRGGQVFYLHNRVSTIESIANQIREMHPKLKVTIAHGQMEERQLEKTMTQFVAGKFDVLVCTTIIESGIDIPNCNTLIIEGVERFGLTQLYQIRGRVGRFKNQAYAYLLLHRHANLFNKARKRLVALKQHNQLGAGFRIAMRDLELRGAGNLLGTRQSGHIADVGFELYCQLLKQSVARLKGEPGADQIRAEVKLDFIASGEGDSASRHTSGTTSFATIKESEYKHSTKIIEAYLPVDYIAEPRLRIDFYRRLALAKTSEFVREIAGEMIDRFGKLPLAAQALIKISEIRILAELAGIRRIENESERLICRLAHQKPKGEFLKSGSRFPRLTEKDPFLRLNEIQKFLQRHVSK